MSVCLEWCKETDNPKISRVQEGLAAVPHPLLCTVGQRRCANRLRFTMNNNTMIYTVRATNTLRVINRILHDGRSASVLCRHPCETVEPVHVHLQGYVQIYSRTKFFQEITYRRFCDHGEMSCIMFVDRLTVIAQIPRTIHTVKPLPSNRIHTQVAKNVHVYDVS